MAECHSESSTRLPIHSAVTVMRMEVKVTQTVRTWNKMNKLSHSSLYKSFLCFATESIYPSRWLSALARVTVSGGRAEGSILQPGPPPPHTKHHAKFPHLFADFVIQCGRKSFHPQWMMRAVTWNLPELASKAPADPACSSVSQPMGISVALLQGDHV